MEAKLRENEELEKKEKDQKAKEENRKKYVERLKLVEAMPRIYDRVKFLLEIGAHMHSIENHALQLHIE